MTTGPEERPDEAKDGTAVDARLQAALQREKLTETAPAAGMSDDAAGSYSSGLGYGMRLGMEFMGGTVVGMGIGYGIDQLFDSSPWSLLLFTLFGFGAGVLNMYRLINQIDDTIGVGRKAVRTPWRGLTKAGQNGRSDAGDNPSDNLT